MWLHVDPTRLVIIIMHCTGLSSTRSPKKNSANLISRWKAVWRSIFWHYLFEGIRTSQNDLIVSNSKKHFGEVYVLQGNTIWIALSETFCQNQKMSPSNKQKLLQNKSRRSSESKTWRGATAGFLNHQQYHFFFINRLYNAPSSNFPTSINKSPMKPY